MGDADQVRQELAARRDATAEQLASLERDFGVLLEASAGVATDDEHDPEGATIAFERAQVAALHRQVASHLRDLDRALASVAQGTYGICERCRLPIAAERLAVRPSARRCITCASAPE